MKHKVIFDFDRKAFCVYKVFLFWQVFVSEHGSYESADDECKIINEGDES